MNNRAFSGHAYAQNSGGTLTSLAQITPDSLRDYHAKALARDNLYIAVTGDITSKELATVLEKIFGNLPAKAQLQTISPVTLQNQGKIGLYKKDIPQTIIEMTQPGISRTDPDYHAAQVMNFILGSSGFGSRLTKTVREKNGLTYGIYTGLDTMDRFNGLTLSTSTKNETAAPMMDLIRQEWQNMTQNPITEQELIDAKNYLIGSVPLSLTSTDHIAGLMLDLQLSGLPKDYLDQRSKAIDALTVEEITALADKLLDMNAMSIVMVGNPEGITPDSLITEIPDVQ
jgi:zinc protease